MLYAGNNGRTCVAIIAFSELADELDMPVLYLFYPSLSEVMATNCESEPWYGMIHACEFETSLMLATKKN